MHSKKTNVHELRTELVRTRLYTEQHVVTTSYRTWSHRSAVNNALVAGGILEEMHGIDHG